MAQEQKHRPIAARVKPSFNVDLLMDLGAFFAAQFRNAAKNRAIRSNSSQAA
jgi:hypothetical protein